MEMIIGGAFQGKGAYAKKKYPELVWAEGGTICEEELWQTQGVLNFQDYIRKEMQAGTDISKLAGQLAEKNPEVVLVSCEVGYGVVPVDAFERAYREAVGRVCTELAAKSRVVTRVICGIGTVIKHA